MPKLHYFIICAQKVSSSCNTAAILNRISPAAVNMIPLSVKLYQIPFVVHLADIDRKAKEMFERLVNKWVSVKV